MRFTVLIATTILSFGVFGQKDCATVDCQEHQLIPVEKTYPSISITDELGTFKVVSDNGKTPAFTSAFNQTIEGFREDQRKEMNFGSYLVVIAGRNELNTNGEGPFLNLNDK